MDHDHLPSSDNKVQIYVHASRTAGTPARRFCSCCSKNEGRVRARCRRTRTGAVSGVGGGMPPLGGSLWLKKYQQGDRCGRAIPHIISGPPFNVLSSMDRPGEFSHCPGPSMLADWPSSSRSRIQKCAKITPRRRRRLPIPCIAGVASCHRLGRPGRTSAWLSKWWPFDGGDRSSVVDRYSNVFGLPAMIGLFEYIFGTGVTRGVRALTRQPYARTLDRASPSAAFSRIPMFALSRPDGRDVHQHRLTEPTRSWQLFVMDWHLYINVLECADHCMTP